MAHVPLGYYVEKVIYPIFSSLVFLVKQLAVLLTNNGSDIFKNNDSGDDDSWKEYLVNESTLDMFNGDIESAINYENDD